MRRHDHVAATRRDIVGQAVEAVLAGCIRHGGANHLSVFALQGYADARHAGVVRHEHVAAYLAVDRSASDGAGRMGGVATVAVVEHGQRIAVGHARNGLRVEVGILLTLINRVGYCIAVLHLTFQHVAVYGLRGRYPAERHATFVVALGVIHRGLKLRYIGTFIEIQALARDGYRQQHRRVVHAQIGIVLVDTYGIAVVGTSVVSYIGIVGLPVAVQETRDTILRNEYLVL